MPSSFDFGGKSMPVPLLVARTLLWIQAALVLVGGLMLVVYALVLGPGYQSNVGMSGVALGLLIGVAQIYCGIKLTKPTITVRNATVAVEIVFGLFNAIYNAQAGIGYIVLPLVVAVATIVPLLLPESARAFAGESKADGPATSASAESGSPAEPKADASEGSATA